MGGVSYTAALMDPPARVWMCTIGEERELKKYPSSLPMTKIQQIRL